MATDTAFAPELLGAELKVQYESQGFVVVRGLFTALEMALISHEAQGLTERSDLIDTKNLRCRWQPDCRSGECLFETFDPVIDIAPLCGQRARDPRLLNLLGQLYGETAYLFKDKLIFKPPGAKGHDLHQDFIAWPNFPRSFITAAVAIDPADASNGATEVFPGYHLQGCLTPTDGDYHPLPETAVDLSTGVMLDMDPGDVALFGCFTPHRSGPNRSANWRRLLYLSYNAASDGGDYRDAHYREFHDWLKAKYAQFGKNETYFQ